MNRVGPGDQVTVSGLSPRTQSLGAANAASLAMLLSGPLRWWALDEA